MFYTALVVSNQDRDLSGKVEVYIPVLMVKQNRNNPEESEHSTKTKLKIYGSSDEVERYNNSKVTESHTLPAYPISLTDKDHGQFLIPEVGDEILIFFKDNNRQIAYYMYASAYKKGKLMDYGKIIEDEENSTKPDKKIDQKVMLLTKSGHVLCFNDTKESNGVILKAGDQHKLRLDTTQEKSSASIETAKGHILILDDTNKGIAVKTTNGHRLSLDDDNKGINLTTTNGLRLTLDDKNNYIQIVTPNGIGLEFDDNNTKLRIDSKDVETTTSNDVSTEAKGSISSSSIKDTTIESKSKIETKSTSDTSINSNANINMKATSNIKQEASSSINLKANNKVEIEGTAGVNVKGSSIEGKAQTKVAFEGLTIELKGTGSAKIESSGMVDVKGAMVTIDGTLISLGKGAASPVIKGMEFMAYFNTHMHMSPIGPTSPPMVPMLPTMLSMTTMTK